MLLLQVTVASGAFAKDTPKADENPWWKTGVFYEIYLRSFQDTNGDGVGDLRGVIKRIDYLKDLGINAVYLSSFFPSPNRDWGYDITDFKGVNKTYGTMADFDELVKKLHKNGIKLVIDFVANHTSDQHPWFKESRSAVTSPKRDWYIWRQGREDGTPPSNWLSVYSGPAWEYDSKTKEYYYHAFFKEQADLNWRNADVRAAMHEVLRFWIKQGVDGFMLNNAAQLTENTQLVDEPDNPYPYYQMPDYERHLHPHTENWVDSHEYVREIRKVFDDEGRGTILLLDNKLLPREVPTWYGSSDKPEAHLVINNALKSRSFDMYNLSRILNEQASLLAPEQQMALVMSDHNSTRLPSKTAPEFELYGFLMLLTYRATPFIYYGDELGMHLSVILTKNSKDPLELLEDGKGLGRDPLRGPMPWDNSKNGGFSKVTPWIPISFEYQHINQESSSKDRKSTLTGVRAILKVRQSIPAFTQGTQSPLTITGKVLSFTRTMNDESYYVLINWGKKPTKFTIPDGPAQPIYSTRRPDLSQNPVAELEIKEFEGIVLRHTPRGESREVR
jgi:alpha-glucosidase